MALTVPAPSAPVAFPVLARQVRAAGLFERSPARSVARVGSIAAMFAAGWVAFALLGDSWFQVGVAVWLAAVSGQIAFLGHDVGHRQFFRSRRLNQLVGLGCANVATGISFGYWVDKHDRHHGHPNQVGVDPDVAPGVISWTAAQADARGPIGRLVSRHQAAAFFPLLLLEGLNMHVSSAAAIRTGAVRHKVLEAGLLIVHVALCFGAAVLLLSPLRAAVFLLVYQGLFGLYLGSAFAPNHKGMVMPGADERWGFVERQVVTSRNVRGSRALDIAMGGLNYQIEHHLFPTMPMANLRRAQPIVRAFCEANGIPYCETGVVASYAAALSALRSSGRPVSAVLGGPAVRPAAG